ncbi:MAG: REP-associated tyrosine transposase [Terriglobia bacterium]
MATISRDAPCLFITAVAKNRLTVFRAKPFKEIFCKALDEARQSAGFAIFAYVVMPDHLHIITDGARKPSEALRFIKGVSAHRILQHLKEQGHQGSLNELRNAGSSEAHKYSVWERHSNVVLLTTEGAFMQRVNYTHQNPVRAGLAEHAVDYRWSSARIWHRQLCEDEPLSVDIGRIVWRGSH